MVDEIMKEAQDLKEEPVVESSGLFHSSVLFTLMKGYSKNLNVEKALSMYSQMKEREGLRLKSSFILNTLLECCLKKGRLEKVIEIFEDHLDVKIKNKRVSEEAVKPILDTMSYSVLARGLFMNKKFEEAMKLPEQMKERGLEADEGFYSHLIDGCSKNKQISLAFEILKGGASVHLPSYNRLISSCMKQGKINEAMTVLKDMKSKNICPDSFSYSTIIKGISKPYLIDNLTELVEMLEVQEKNPDFKPDEILYNVLLDSCIKCRRLNMALSIFAKISSPDSLVTPDEISYNTIIKGCSLNKKMDKAFEMFNLMIEKKLTPNDVTYNSLIDACVRCSSMEKAYGLFAEM